MVEKPTSGRLLGIPYNFDKPSLRRLLSAYWKPGQGILVEKPFGIGYTLNLANPRSWLVIAVAGFLVWRERGRESPDTAAGEPVEVVVED